MSRGKTKKHGKKPTKNHPASQKKAPTKSESGSSEYIGSIHEAPEYVVDNLHIFGGYRINYDTPKKIFRSLFMLHNESVNIWTHLFAAIAVLIVIGYAVFFISPYVSAGGSGLNLNDRIKEQLKSLENLTFIKQISEGADEKLELMKNSIKEAYHEFLNATKSRLQQTNNTITQLKEHLEQRFHTAILNIVELKEEFETHGVADILDMVKHVGDGLNSSVITNFKHELAHLTDKFIELSDSKQADFFDPIHSPNPTFVSRWPVFIFLCSATICLMCSTTFHLFYPMSGKVNKIFSRLDYAGINILISGSAFPPLYYGLYCNINLAIFYLSLIAVIATAVFIICLFEWIHKGENKIYKALLFGGFGVFLIVPTSHMLINEYIGNWGDQFTLVHCVPWIACVGASYLFGLYVYTVQCPERHNPGQYDVCGHSHQIWHLFVVAGIVFTYMLALQVFEQRKDNACPAIKLH